jgi:hypothetical protein
MPNVREMFDDLVKCGNANPEMCSATALLGKNKRG